MSLDDPVRRHAHERPDALAVRAGKRELTYADLDAAADRIARRLAAAGVVAGDRVATALPPGADFAALLHATPRLGAALVPLSARLTGGERDAALAVSAPRIVVDEPLAGSEADLPDLGAARRPEAAHTVVFTSGTTATPKPVSLTYANHLASARASAANLGVEPDDRWLCALPVHHIGGLAVLLRSAINGTAAVVHERFDADAVTDSLESGEATLVSLVPTQLRRLIAAGFEIAPALRAALLGGGPSAPELLAWATERGLPFLQTYGMTETASQIVTMPASEALEAGRCGSAGRALQGVELRIASGDAEILVRGPMVSRGTVAADGWLHTGDRGALDADGYLWVEGRLDDVIVTGGENVAAGEVEAALTAHPAVAEAAVVGHPDSEWGQAVTAYVVHKAGAEPASDEELLGHCRRRLAPFKIPKRIHRLSALPHTESGKVARARLPAVGDPESERVG